MKRKIIASLLAGLLFTGVLPLGVNAEWKQNYDNTWSWLDSDGDPIYYEWKYINGSWYFFNSDGIMQTGWVTDVYTYYMGTDGTMKTGWITDNGKSYYLGADGKLAKDTVIDGIYVNKDGAAQPKEQQKVLLDNKYVKITYLGVNDTGYSKQLKLQIENKSNEQLIIQADNTSINGYMAYALFSSTVLPGKNAIDEIEFNDSDITNGFNTIEGDFTINKGNYTRIENDAFSINL